MRLKLLYEQTLTYEQFIEQPNWIEILYTNYLTNQPPLAAPNPALSTINNNVDHFEEDNNPIQYLSRLPEPINDHLTRALLLRTKNPHYIYRYARYVIKGRWPEAEEIIKQDPQWAYYYAAYVIGGRWPEAEETIRQSHYAYCYAREVINGRWPEAEETISQSPQRYGCLV